MTTLAATHRHNEEAVREHWVHSAKQFDLEVPVRDGTQIDEIDAAEVAFWSGLVYRGNLSLPDTVRILRGQTTDDPRPNKDLYELQELRDPVIADTITKWNRIVRHGVTPRWSTTKPHMQTSKPRNQRRIVDHGPQIRRHLRKGQLEGRYLIVSARLLDRWNEVFISPLGVVDKPDPSGTDIRLINNYAFPPEASVNDYTDRSDHPPISYNPPRSIARRIHRLKKSNPTASVLVLLGDVAGAFRHIPIHADAVHMFGFLYDDVLVIDLSCGFGWCGSPSYYALAGKIINHLYEAMATVLGPTAINERKFTKWSTKAKALGLLWDTVAGSVSIPEDIITKAKDRVNNLLSSRTSTKKALEQALGSLRHVASCSHPARAFFQRLQCTTNATPRFGTWPLSTTARDDLRWFNAVLQQPQRFNSIPVAQFADQTEPDVHVFMDASGEGLCALEPGLNRYFRQRFSSEECVKLSINVRELRSAVLAVLHWGPRWKKQSEGLTHVQFHIDNTTAVAWTNRRASNHPMAQLYNRLLSLAEFQYNLACSATHIPGKLNVMADAGSRAWSSNKTDPTSLQWANLSNSWVQDKLDPLFNNLSAVWD
eukprot:jgi/Phyca11/101049/e_gw1.5.581.1